MRRYEDIKIALAVSLPESSGPSERQLLRLNRIYADVTGFFHPLSACFIVAESDRSARVQNLLKAAVFEDLRTSFDWALWINGSAPDAVAAPQPDAVAAPQPDAVAAPQPDAVAAPQLDAVAAPQPRVISENLGLRFLKDIVDFALDEKLDAATAGVILKGPDETIKLFDYLLVSMNAVREFCKSNPSDKWFPGGDSVSGLAEKHKPTPEEIFCAWLETSGLKISHASEIDAGAAAINATAANADTQGTSTSKFLHFPADVVFLDNPAGTAFKTLKNPASITLDAINVIKAAAELKSVALYGAGTVARALMPILKNSVTLVVDGSAELSGKDFFGLKIQSPDALKKHFKDKNIEAVIITPLGRQREIEAHIAKILGDSNVSLKTIAFDGAANNLNNAGSSTGSSKSPRLDKIDTGSGSATASNGGTATASNCGAATASNGGSATASSNGAADSSGSRIPVAIGDFNTAVGGQTRPASLVIKSSDLQKTTLRTLTSRAVLYVGYPCNIKCIFCYYAHTPSKVWHSIDECKADALLYRSTYRNDQVDITGGEPTIYPHILELVEYCSEIGLTPTLITNMQALAEREKLAQLKSRGVYDFLCSVHALGESYEFLTKKKGAWGNLLRAVDNLQHLDMRWRVNCTMTAINRRQLIDIARFAYENGARVINFINYNPFHEWEAKMDIDFQSRHSELTPYLTEALDYCDDVGLEANVRYFPFCRMKGHEDKCYNFSQLSYDHHEWDFASWYSEKTGNPSEKIPANIARLADGQEEDFRRFTARLMKEKLFCQSHECRICALDPICDGFSNQYASRFGMDETLPYFESVITDPTHLIKRQKKVVDIR